MPDRRILLFGLSGQLGHELRAALAPLGHVTALNRAAADFSRPESLRAVVRRYTPHIVINAAAYTSVDRAESEPDLANTVNAEAPQVLAEEAQTLGACMVHYSTDYVFDGRKATAYVEDDLPNALSVYGRSKLAGERAVATACHSHLILRTCWLFGVHGGNFLKTILRLAAERDTLRVVADQYGAPTSAETVAAVTTQLLTSQLPASPANPHWGVYHVSAIGETTWHGYARHIVEQARNLGMPLKASADTVIPITSADYSAPAPRPASSRLDTEKLRSRFGIDLPHWQRGVDQALRQISSIQTI